MANTMKPSNKDAVSVRSVPVTQEDRAKNLESFRERKREEQELKDQRFAEIKERRKGRKPSGGSGGGINIEVTSDR